MEMFSPFQSGYICQKWVCNLAQRDLWTLVFKILKRIVAIFEKLQYKYKPPPAWTMQFQASFFWHFISSLNTKP